MKKIWFPLSVMSICSLLLLLGLSVLTYIFKWKADTALIGITLIYIVVGFIGGCCKKHMSYEMNMFKKLLEGGILGSIFMGLLFLGSLLFVGNEVLFGSRFVLIWLLVAGSASLGRIL